MVRALFGKEWTQLRSTRWVGFALALLLPPFLVTGAEAARRGWLPTGTISGYTVTDLFLSALPGMMTALLGFLALLVASQVFAGDRASGTEAFLLERPVPRAKTWRARLIASLLTVLALAVFSFAYWLALVALAAEPTAAQWHDSLLAFARGGVVTLVCFLAGVAAATLLPAPLQAVLLGLVLAFLPFGLSALLGENFPLAAVGKVPIGTALPWLLPAAYLVASFAMACRGEPAGRGRVKRGLSFLGASLLAVFLLFLIAAPLLVRASAKNFEGLSFVTHGGEGSAGCALRRHWSNGSGWIVDLERKRLLRFLAPPVWDAAWNEDGSRLAVLHSSQILGGIGEDFRVSLFDGRGAPAGDDLIVARSVQWVTDLRWAGSKLLAKANLEVHHSAILVIEPRTATVRRIAIDGQAWTWWFVGPTLTGEVFVHQLEEGTQQYRLYRVDFDGGALEPAALLEEEGFATYTAKWISPSGRYWLRGIGQPMEGMWLVDLHTGEEFSLTHCTWAGWLEGDRLACLARDDGGVKMTLGTPGAPRETLRTWRDVRVAAEVAPGRRRILVQAWQVASVEEAEAEADRYIFWSGGRYWRTGGELRALQVYSAGPGSWSDLLPRLEEPPEDFAVHWAGAETLALNGPGWLALMDLEGTAPPRNVIGSP